MERFTIITILENGFLLYKIFDLKSKKITHCGIGELNDTLYKLIAG